MISGESVRAVKRAMRKALLDARSQARMIDDSGSLLWTRLQLLLDRVPKPSGKLTIAGYWPLHERHELDPLPLLQQARNQGYRLALPTIVGKDKPLVFRRWQPGDRLVDAPMGTQEPDPRARVLKPWLILVPLIGFDNLGGRLGYGGGYYDRTLQALRGHNDVLAVGIAFDVQRVVMVPMTEHDQRLDAVITERHAMLVGRSLRQGRR